MGGLVRIHSRVLPLAVTSLVIGSSLVTAYGPVCASLLLIFAVTERRVAHDEEACEDNGHYNPNLEYENKGGVSAATFIWRSEPRTRHDIKRNVANKDRDRDGKSEQAHDH